MAPMIALVATANDSALPTKVAFVTGVVGLCFGNLCASVACGLFLARPPVCSICCLAPRLCSGVGLDCHFLKGSDAKCFERFVRCLLRRSRALKTANGPVVQGVASASRAGMALDDLLPRAFFPR